MVLIWPCLSAPAIKLALHQFIKVFLEIYKCHCVYPPARCYMAQCAHKSFGTGSQRLLRTHQRDSIIFGIIYERLTDLSPSCSTRHRKNAVWPMRAVTFRGTSKSKYGCSDIFCSMRLLSAAA